MNNTFYVKIIGDRDKIEDVLMSASFDYQFDSNVNIGNIENDVYELVVDKEFNKFKEFNSLEPLFTNVDEEKIKNHIYDLVNRPDLFSRLCEFRDKEVYGLEIKYE